MMASAKCECCGMRWNVEDDGNAVIEYCSLCYDKKISMLAADNARLRETLKRLVEAVIAVQYATVTSDDQRVRLVMAIGDASLLTAREAGKEVRGG